MKTKKLEFPGETVCYGILIHVFFLNTSVYVFVTEIFWHTFDLIIDDPYLTLKKDSAEVYKQSAWKPWDFLTVPSNIYSASSNISRINCLILIP
jgi:hypothetical protein